MYKMMTAGPTQIRENVRMAMSIERGNPDIDSDFCEYYHNVCLNLSKFFNTENEFYILGGEGILGLEAACASLTEKGDRVLVIDNGVYGKGFSDFVKMYGGEVVLYTVDYKNPVDVNKLEQYIKNDSNFKYTTVVHCDTPSGILNDVCSISSMLKKYNIMSVVDSVSASFGEPLSMGDIDILCLGSQKALSAPAGLTMIGVSDIAKKSMEERKTPIASFYANIMTFKSYYEDKWFPYTMPIYDIYALGQALENVMNDREIFERHKKIATAVRNAIFESGLTLYTESGFSNTVTVINVPEGLCADEIVNEIRNKYNILISGSFDIFKGKVLRIGHMGENANLYDVSKTLYALEKTLLNFGFKLNTSIEKAFIKYYYKL